MPARSRPVNGNPSCCPHCGCNAAELINAGVRWGRPWALFACDHCGEQFGLGQRPRSDGTPAYRIPYPKISCPACAGKRTRVISSPAKAPDRAMKDRYHECLDCRYRFASYDAD
ncbi:MAG TPA: hypothetical protein PKC18_18555 [Lacipirellulaceae bacterium]|nr:hypothetical protein [Lacipirellulaceae bacterium]